MEVHGEPHQFVHLTPNHDGPASPVRRTRTSDTSVKTARYAPACRFSRSSKRLSRAVENAFMNRFRFIAGTRNCDASVAAHWDQRAECLNARDQAGATNECGKITACA
jgi:hypothetical protein